MYVCIKKHLSGSTKYLFLENALKKTTKYFLKFLFFYLKVQSFRLIMENNFIKTAASAGDAVAYTIGPIFKHIIQSSVCSCISPMASQILCFKASIVSGLSA